jgi:hypothetical protein
VAIFSIERKQRLLSKVFQQKVLCKAERFSEGAVNG